MELHDALEVGVYHVANIELLLPDLFLFELDANEVLGDPAVDCTDDPAPQSPTEVVEMRPLVPASLGAAFRTTTPEPSGRPGVFSASTGRSATIVVAPSPLASAGSGAGSSLST